MPWEHCGQQVPDDVRCPTCNTSKQAWTVKLDATRVFRLSDGPPEPWKGDAAAQAQALRQAAAQGAPFCEECERSRQERAGAEATSS